MKTVNPFVNLINGGLRADGILKLVRLKKDVATGMAAIKSGKLSPKEIVEVVRTVDWESGKLSSKDIGMVVRTVTWEGVPIMSIVGIVAMKVGNLSSRDIVEVVSLCRSHDDVSLYAIRSCVILPQDILAVIANCDKWRNEGYSRNLPLIIVTAVKTGKLSDDQMFPLLKMCNVLAEWDVAHKIFEVLCKRKRKFTSEYKLNALELSGGSDTLAELFQRK